MKKLLMVLFLLLLIGAGITAWLFLGSGTGFDASTRTLYIRPGAANQKSVMDSLRKKDIVSSPALFQWLARRMDYWGKIKPGKYEIKKGSSLLSIVRMLRNGRQTPVDLVITKIRTKEDLARITGARFHFSDEDMLNYLQSTDSLKRWNVDTSTVISLLIPDTYTYFWTADPDDVFKKLAAASEKFWTTERQKQAADHGLSPVQAYVLASIVEEETTNNKEKGTIASVYINRLSKGMPLQADPTIKFAMGNFALTRIYEKYLFVESPYNTYRNKGLPPGPICTPSKTTLDAVLQSPKTDYLYFVAHPKLRETHDFSVTYEEHLKKARVYQQELNRRDSLRALSN